MLNINVGNFARIWKERLGAHFGYCSILGSNRLLFYPLSFENVRHHFIELVIYHHSSLNTHPPLHVIGWSFAKKKHKKTLLLCMNWNLPLIIFYTHFNFGFVNLSAIKGIDMLWFCNLPSVMVYLQLWRSIPVKLSLEWKNTVFSSISIGF